MSDRAEGIIETTDIPLDEASMQEFKKARSEGKDSVVREVVDVPDESSEVESVEQKKISRGGFQKRIDRLIKQQAATEERAAAAERKAAELEAKLTSTAPKTESNVDTEPQRENFQTEAEYVRALTRWEVKQEMKAEREAEEKAARDAEAKEAISAYNKKAIESQSQHEDWNEVFKQDINIPTIVGDAIIHTIKNGPEVAYFLGKNPEICEEMISVHPLEAVAMAVKISEQLEANAEEEEESEEEKEPVAVAAPAKRRAPAPIKPVTGGTSRSTIPLDKASFSDYKKLRAQGRTR